MRVRYLYTGMGIGMELVPRDFEGKLIAEDEKTITLEGDRRHGTLKIDRTAIERARQYDEENPT